MIEILVVRDPDGYDDVRVWDDGDEITGSAELNIVKVDAGAGHDYDDWKEMAKEAFEGGESLGFRNAVYAAFADPPGSKYIDGFPD